jgi:hypothetical protein
MKSVNFLTDRQKLEQISNFFRLSAVDFAEKIDVSKDKIYNIRRGVVVNFPPDVLRNIAKCCPEISPYWLITGEGSMLSGSIEHHNAVANDHSKAVVNHTENTGRDEVLKSQQQTIDRLSRIIEKLTIK